MKLLGSTETEIIKDKNGENVPHSKPLEVEDKINLTLIIKQYGYYKNALFN